MTRCSLTTTFQTLAVPSARCTYPHIHVWYLQYPPFERKRADKQTHKPTYLPSTYRPTDYNNPSLRMRARGLLWNGHINCACAVCGGGGEGGMYDVLYTSDNDVISTSYGIINFGFAGTKYLAPALSRPRE